VNWHSSSRIAGRETVMPSEYNREVFGGEMPEFSSLDETKEQSDDRSARRFLARRLVGRCLAHEEPYVELPPLAF
jgi:hypothetical protein